MIAGNLLVDGSGEDRRSTAVRIAEAAFGPVGSESPPAVAIAFAGHLAAHRVDAAAARLARVEDRRRRLREARRRQRERFRDLPGAVSRATLDSIASCESGGDPRIVSSNGLYHGKYQFSLETWASVGGQGSPAEAPEIEQDYRAALLYERSGPGQWPVCGS